MKRTDISRLQINRSIYLKIGFIVSLSFTILAFNYTTEDRPYEIPSGKESELIEEIPIIRTAEQKKPLPPPLSLVTEEIIPEDVPDFIEEPLPEPIEPTVEIDKEIKEPVFKPVERPKKEPTPIPVLPKEDDSKYGEIHIFAEEMPRFPGCEDELDKELKKACATKQLLSYIYKNIKYPGIARHNNIQGTVVIGFIIERDGQLSNIKILREIGGGCGKEAARVIKNMPLWTPGKQNGRPVRVQYRLPVKYKLE